MGAVSRIDAVERIGLLTTFAALKGANWLTSADSTVAVTALFHKTPRSHIGTPPAPTTSLDTVGKQIAEAVTKAKAG